MLYFFTNYALICFQKLTRDWYPALLIQYHRVTSKHVIKKPANSSAVYKVSFYHGISHQKQHSPLLRICHVLFGHHQVRHHFFASYSKMYLLIQCELYRKLSNLKRGGKNDFNTTGINNQNNKKLQKSSNNSNNNKNSAFETIFFWQAQIVKKCKPPWVGDRIL